MAEQEAGAPISHSVPTASTLATYFSSLPRRRILTCISETCIQQAAGMQQAAATRQIDGVLVARLTAQNYQAQIAPQQQGTRATIRVTTIPPFVCSHFLKRVHESDSKASWYHAGPSNYAHTGCLCDDARVTV